MNRFLVAVALACLIPSAASATRGGADRNWYRNLEKYETMRRNGGMQELMDEGRANAEAFRRLKERERAGWELDATGSLRPGQRSEPTKGAGIRP